jgi:dephospho-CoA kinase
MSPDGSAFAPIAERFGPAVLAADGTIDRTVLARILFADPAARGSWKASFILSSLRHEG